MLGFPQIIVTREFLYKFLAECGWSKSERGYGSIDFSVFGRSPVDAPLTDEARRDELLTQVSYAYRR